jgi:hypothetical protein
LRLADSLAKKQNLYLRVGLWAGLKVFVVGRGLYPGRFLLCKIRRRLQGPLNEPSFTTGQRTK